MQNAKERALALAARIVALRAELAATEAEFEGLFGQGDDSAPTSAPATSHPIGLVGNGSLSDRAVAAIVSAPERSWTAKAIAKAIGLDDYNKLRGSLPRLVKIGKIRKVARGRFQAPTRFVSLDTSAAFVSRRSPKLARMVTAG